MGSKIYSKVFQGVFSVVNQFMPHRQPRVVEGIGSFKQLPLILAENGVKNPMIVTGPRVGKSQYVADLAACLSSSYLYAEVKTDPPLSQIEQMVHLYKEHNCDCIVAIGGGSNMDAAKAMGAAIARPQETVAELGGVMKVRREIPFFVAVPTTAGTGSECTVAAVVTDEKLGRKFAINDPVLCPDVAILDASLTVSLPATLTGYTGMDALTHAVEAYLNKAYHISNTKEMAESAIRDIFKFLPRAYTDGNDMEAREKMLKASYNAGIAFTVACVGYVHAIAHTFGGQYGIQHGLANAVILPHVLEAYRPKCDADLAHLCDLAGVACDGDDSEKASAFIAEIRSLNKAIGIPEKFNVLDETKLGRMVEWADRESNPLYPCPVFFKKEDFERIIRIVG